MQLYEALLDEMWDAEQKANQKSLEQIQIKGILIHPSLYHELEKEEAEEVKKGKSPFFEYNFAIRQITFFGVPMTRSLNVKRWEIVI